MGTVDRAASVLEVTPLLFVEDIDRSVDFYRDRLGFEVTERWESAGKLAWCRLDRGGAAVMLQQACAEDGSAEGRGRGVTFYFLCDDADAMHAELCASGLRVDAPEVAFYGMKQLFVNDPDGYALCFQNRVE
jgi:uncharacterized glyoxalase superfamily protein PhnB